MAELGVVETERGPAARGEAARGRSGGQADDTRRTRIVDAAIRILAEEGARALSHRAIDRATALPLGSTSNFFKTRRDILLAACERIVDLDLIDLGQAGPPARCLREELERVSAMVVRFMSPPNQDRARARLELYLAATRDTEIASVLATRWRAEITELTERGLLAIVPDVPPRTMELYRALLTGLLMRSALVPGGLRDPLHAEGFLLDLIPMFQPVPGASLAHNLEGDAS